MVVSNSCLAFSYWSLARSRSPDKGVMNMIIASMVICGEF